MRFYGTLKFNGYIVGKGYGSNKKQVKQVAARVALMNLVPKLYRQWKSQREPQGSPSLSESMADGSVHSSIEKDQNAFTSPTPLDKSIENLKENIVPK